MRVGEWLGCGGRALGTVREVNWDSQWIPREWNGSLGNGMDPLVDPMVDPMVAQSARSDDVKRLDVCSPWEVCEELCGLARAWCCAWPHACCVVPYWCGLLVACFVNRACSDDCRATRLMCVAVGRAGGGAGRLVVDAMIGAHCCSRG